MALPVNCFCLSLFCTIKTLRVLTPLSAVSNRPTFIVETTLSRVHVSHPRWLAPVVKAVVWFRVRWNVYTRVNTIVSGWWRARGCFSHHRAGDGTFLPLLHVRHVPPYVRVSGFTRRLFTYLFARSVCLRVYARVYTRPLKLQTNMNATVYKYKVERKVSVDVVDVVHFPFDGNRNLP